MTTPSPKTTRKGGRKPAAKKPTKQTRAKAAPEPATTDEALDEGTPLIEHLRELRMRLVRAMWAVSVGFILCYAFKQPLFNFLILPLVKAQGPGPHMVFTAVQELFFTYLKLSFLGGLFLAFPYILYQVWQFMAPGLYRREKRVLLPFMVATPLLFYLGGIFTYLVLEPAVLKFFFAFQTSTIRALPSVGQYLGFMTTMTFALGLTFELPVFLLLLCRAGVLSPAGLAKFRRYALILVLIVAAFLAPPDPLSQLLLAIPMMGLYEVAIWIGRLWLGDGALKETTDAN